MDRFTNPSDEFNNFLPHLHSMAWRRLCGKCQWPFSARGGGEAPIPTRLSHYINNTGLTTSAQKQVLLNSRGLTLRLECRQIYGFSSLLNSVPLISAHVHDYYFFKIVCIFSLSPLRYPFLNTILLVCTPPQAIQLHLCDFLWHTHFFPCLWFFPMHSLVWGGHCKNWDGLIAVLWFAD